MNFLKLIRYQNLLMLALMQLIIHFGFLKQQNIPLALADWQFLLLVLATVCIGAGGYLINNVFDVATDLENKPQNVVINNGITEAAAYNCYFALNIVGVGAGFYLSNAILRPGFAAAFIIVAATLYLYANSLKRMLLIGNIVVALLLAFSVIIVGIFDLLPAITIDNRRLMATLFGIIIDYAAFAFLLNLIREIVKDIEDVNGDYNQGMNTLPIALGVTRAAKIAFALGLVAVVALGWYIYEYIFNLIYAAIYGLVFLIGPLIFFTVKIWSAKKPKEFNPLSTLLKWIVLFGIISIIVITINMKANA